MSRPKRDVKAEDNVRRAEFAERFEAGEIEIDGTSLVRLPRELFGVHGFLGVVLTPIGALSASDPEELNEQVRAFAAREWCLDVEEIQVTLRLVAASEIEASMLQDLFEV